MSNLTKFVKAELPISESVSIDCYLMPSGEKRIGITGAALAAGRAKGYLSQVVNRDSKSLKALQSLGFTGEIIKGYVVQEDGQASSVVETISARDFTKYIAWEATQNGNIFAASTLEVLIGADSIDKGTVANCYLHSQINADPKQEKACNEKKIQAKLAKKVNGRLEVPCKSGVIDILTDTEIIEVKKVSGWKSAIGQVLAYRCEYPERNARIHLFGECSNEYRQMIVSFAGSLNVSVSFE